MVSGSLNQRLTKSDAPQGIRSRLGLSRVALRKPQPAFDSLLLEVPQVLELMAARLRNGENIYAVLSDAANLQGQFGTALSRLARRLFLGETLENALDTLAAELNSEVISEFVNKLKLSLSRGTPIAEQLQQLAATARSRLRVAQLRAAGRNELRMLIPLVFLILPVTIAFAIFPSLQLLQLGF